MLEQLTTQEIAERIAARLAATRSALAEAREAFKAVEQEELRLARALRALTPEDPLVATPPKEPKTKPPTRRKNTVSEATVEKTLAVIRDTERPVTVKYVAETLGMSTSAAGIAVEALREQGVIRLAGRVTAPGSPYLYAIMNGAGDG